MTGIKGCDLAWEKPAPSALAAAGIRFCVLYVGQDQTGKNMDPQYVADLAAHGIWTVTNFEYAAQQMNNGYRQGKTDAQIGLAEATACGMPAGRPIYFSADWDVTPAQEAAVTAYLQGADSVLGASLTGEYAGFYPIRVAQQNGTAAWLWQALTAWSGGNVAPNLTIRQTGATESIGGFSVDIDEALVPDYGQWMPGRLPNFAPAAAPLQEDPVFLCDANSPNTVSPGIYLLTGGGYIGIDSPALVDDMKAKGVPVLTVDAEQHRRFMAAYAPEPLEPAEVSGVAMDPVAFAKALVAELLAAAKTATAP